MALEKTKIRNPAVDIVRCFAFLNVVVIHFFLNGGFYEETVSGWLMYFMTLVRTAATVCVPLFLVISGYLLNNRRPIRKYYTKLGKTVVIYVLSSLCCLLYRYIFLHQPPSLVGAVLDILCYAAAPYSWYIEMYFGLFLIIPFLNILYQNIPDKKGKQRLILILLVMTALPSVTNIYSLTGLHWWLTPSSSNHYAQILPEWWVNFYPITYYFIGCYLKEYPIKIRLRYCAVLLVLASLLIGTFNYYRSYGSAFVWGAWNEWCSLLVVVQTVLVFTLLSRLNYQGISSKMAGFLGKLSEWSLGAYLVSWIFDQAVYPVLKNIQPNAQLRFFYLPVVVAIISAGSVMLSAVINLIYSGIEKLLSIVRLKVKTRAEIP